MKCEIIPMKVVVPIEKVSLELSPEEAKMLLVVVGNITGSCDLRWKCTSEIYNSLTEVFPDFHSGNPEHKKLKSMAREANISFDWI